MIVVPCGRVGYDDRMPSRIVHRIERELGMAGLVDALASKLSASDLRSMLMESYRARSGAVTEAAILAHAHPDPPLAPTTVKRRGLMAFDSLAFPAASEIPP